jgi:hypothetical protein
VEKLLQKKCRKYYGEKLWRKDLEPNKIQKNYRKKLEKTFKKCKTTTEDGCSPAASTPSLAVGAHLRVAARRKLTGGGPLRAAPAPPRATARRRSPYPSRRPCRRQLNREVGRSRAPYMRDAEIWGRKRKGKWDSALRSGGRRRRRGCWKYALESTGFDPLVGSDGFDPLWCKSPNGPQML